jgi:Ser/Thr protein kinase RdoA (MazF antagonist)
MAASLRPSETAAIRALALAGQTEAAKIQLAVLITRLFSLSVTNLTINADQYSLNSLNGFFESGDEKFFFKFHQEEGEEQMSGEYYRAGLLAAAGMPVDMPVHVSALPGEQILIYKRRADPRFADILRALDITDNAAARAEAA